MNPNGVIEDARAFRHLPDGGPKLVKFVQALSASDKKVVVLDLLERRNLPLKLDEAGLDVLAEAADVSTAVVREGFDLAAETAISPLLKVHPPTGQLDPIANVAAGKTRVHYEQILAAFPAAKKRLSQRGITGTVEKVTGRLNALNLDDPRRLVLAQPAVYEVLFIDALDDGQVASDDAPGITDHIVGHVDEQALVHLLRGIVDAVLDANQITLSEDERADLARLAVTRDVSLRPSKLTASVLELVEIRRRQGSMPRFVDHYLALQEINPEAVDEPIRQAMIEYLVGLQLKMTFAAVVNREFDEYFALAYDEARKQRSASDDPIDLARSGRRAGTASDFTIRRVSERDSKFVRPRAINAAGALYTIYVEGELMRLFDIADALSLEWHRGGLDISEGDVASLLNRMEHLRKDRLDEDERGMYYRRLLNYGDAELLSGSLVNERFGEHFDRLMYEVTRFVDLQDRSSNDPRQISRAGVFSAITSVQHNLSQFVNGGAFVKIEELLSHLNEAVDLVSSPPIVARYGGVEQSVTSTIKNLGLGFLDASLPVEDLFELAERGNDVFNFVAGFSRGNVREEPFQEFLEAAQQTIIARASVDEGAWQPEDRDYRRQRRRRHHEDDDAASRNGHEPVPAAIDDWDR